MAEAAPSQEPSGTPKAPIDSRIPIYADEEFMKFAKTDPNASPEQVHQYMTQSLTNAEKRVRYEDLLAQNLSTGDAIKSGELSPEQFADEATERQLAQEREIAELKREKAAMEQLVDRDPYNPEVLSYNGFYRAMKIRLAICRRNNIQYMVMYAMDIDGFGEYNNRNDTFDEEGQSVVSGNHVEGDKALGLAGGLIKNALRVEDIVARLHGDEYVVVTNNMHRDERVMVAERMREAIAEMPTLLGTPIPLTASIGMIIIGPELTQRNFKSDEELKEAVDKAYALADRVQYVGAKHAGKNRIGVGDYETGKIQTVVFNKRFTSPPFDYEDPAPIPQSREAILKHTRPS